MNIASKSRVKNGKKMVIGRQEIACEVASMVYKLITNVLHKCRDSAKIQLFHDVLYLFTGWGTGNNAGNQKNVNQKTLRMHWKDSETEDIDYVRRTQYKKEMRIQDRYNMNIFEAEETNDENKKILRMFIRDHPEMCLIVQHDVYVSGEQKRLRFSIYIVDVVCKLVSAFWNMESNSSAGHALCIDKTALKVIIVMSLAFRKIVDRTLQDVDDCNVVKWANMPIGKTKNTTGKRKSEEQEAYTSNGSNSYVFPEVLGVSLDWFQPSNSRQRETLSQMCLNLKKASTI